MRNLLHLRVEQAASPVYRNKTRNRIPPGNRAKFLGTCALLGLAVGAGMNEYTTYRIVQSYVLPDSADEDFIEDLVVRATGHEAPQVDCVPDTQVDTIKSEDTEAWVARPDTTVHLRTSVCDGIILYSTEARRIDRYHSSESVVALGTLAHEVVHSKGINGVNGDEKVHDEAEAQCYTIQLAQQYTEVLDKSPENARNATRALAQYTRQLPAEYQSDACRDGGTLDLDPDHRGVFPYPL